MDAQQLALLQSELWHLLFLGVVGILSAAAGVIAWLVRRDIRLMDIHFQSIDAKLADAAETASWCKGVLEASGIRVRPLGAGVGGSS